MSVQTRCVQKITGNFVTRSHGANVWRIWKLWHRYMVSVKFKAYFLRLHLKNIDECLMPEIHLRAQSFLKFNKLELRKLWRSKLLTFWSSKNSRRLCYKINFITKYWNREQLWSQLRLFPCFWHFMNIYHI